jgi:hypothetical protein
MPGEKRICVNNPGKMRQRSRKNAIVGRIFAVLQDFTRALTIRARGTPEREGPRALQHGAPMRR